VLVPRHFERSRDVARRLQALGFTVVYRKDLLPGMPPGTHPRPDCLLVNTTGELRHFYRHASVVFIGKSLAAHGGQNPIEPAALAKPIVFGPNMENFREISSAFLAANAAIQAADEPSLKSAIQDLLAHPEKRDAMGRCAAEVVRENRGGLERTMDMIIEKLDSSVIYVAPRC
jgi:3-deoxy-D-manno-octulosonic-acid transferase